MVVCVCIHLQFSASLSVIMAANVSVNIQKEVLLDLNYPTFLELWNSF